VAFLGFCEFLRKVDVRKVRLSILFRVGLYFGFAYKLTWNEMYLQ